MSSILHKLDPAEGVEPSSWGSKPHLPSRGRRDTKLAGVAGFEPATYRGSEPRALPIELHPKKCRVQESNPYGPPAPNAPRASVTLPHHDSRPGFHTRVDVLLTTLTHRRTRPPAAKRPVFPGCHRSFPTSPTLSDIAHICPESRGQGNRTPGAVTPGRFPGDCRNPTSAYPLVGGGAGSRTRVRRWSRGTSTCVVGGLGIPPRPWRFRHAARVIVRL